MRYYRLTTSTHILQPLPVSEDSVHRGRCSVGMRNMCRNRFWRLYSRIQQLTSNIWIADKLYILPIMRSQRCSNTRILRTSFDVSGYVSGQHNRTHLTAAVYTWFLTDHRMSRRRHRCLKLPNANRFVYTCEHTPFRLRQTISKIYLRRLIPPLLEQGLASRWSSWATLFCSSKGQNVSQIYLHSDIQTIEKNAQLHFCLLMRRTTHYSALVIDWDTTRANSRTTRKLFCVVGFPQLWRETRNTKCPH